MRVRVVRVRVVRVVASNPIMEYSPARTSSRYQAFEKEIWKPSEDASQKSSWNKIGGGIAGTGKGMGRRSYRREGWGGADTGKEIGRCRYR